MTTRRDFLATTMTAAAAFAAAPAARAAWLRAQVPGLRYGMVTYLWGRDLRLGALLAACADAGLEAVELRTTHAHGVEPSLDAAARRELRARIADTPVVLAGLGSDERFDSPDRVKVEAAKARTRAFLELSADLGATGVKVKPDSFHAGVERARTIAQIGAALGELGPFAADLGQEIRLEVHGTCADPRTIAEIVAIAGHPAVRVCWNSNREDTKGLGLEANFALLRPSFGGTMHVPVASNRDYPLVDLVALAERSGYAGFVLLETHDAAPDPLVPALVRERETFASMRRRALLPRPDAARPVAITARADDAATFEVRADDTPFATVRLGRDQRVPVVHPLCAPHGASVVRGFPIAPGPRDESDHPHHRGLWFAHGDVDGADFWHSDACRVEVRSHAVEGDTLRFEAEWLADGKPIARERRTMRFLATALSHRVEIDLELASVGEAVVLGDTKEGSLALRLAPELRVDGSHARGRLENAEGLRDAACWGRPSAWCLAEGPLDGRLVRVTMRDRAPDAARPVRWHARNYGLLAANVAGRRAFDGDGAAEVDGAEVQARRITREEPLRLAFEVRIELPVR